MKLSKVLICARQLITSPEHWTQKVMARDKEGNEVCPGSNEAKRYCALGALERTIFDLGLSDRVGDRTRVMDEATRLLRDATSHYTHDGNTCFIQYLNDEYGHATTLLVFDDAIKLALASEVRDLMACEPSLAHYSRVHVDEH